MKPSSQSSLNVSWMHFCAALLCCAVGSATFGGSGSSQVSGVLDNSQRVMLTGHVSALARAGVDAGEVSPSLQLSELQLVFKRTPTQSKALETLLANQQDRASSQFHRWLTPAQFGARFGVSDRDLASAAAWLRSEGFTVGNVSQGRGYLPFAGTASQVESAFQTQIHGFDVDGERHYAAISDPAVPAAFRDLIGAIGGLHDFYPKPGSRVVQHPQYTPGNNELFAVPADVATAYNFTALYQAGINGSGTVIAVVGQSDIQSSVLTQYWNAVGVAQSQQFSSMSVPSSAGGSDPGITNDSNETEAYLDTEVIGALAPAAQIILVRDRNSNTAAQYAIDQNLAPVLNISFGSCEFLNGTAGNAQIQSMYQQAVSQGITVLVATADAGVAACDDGIRGKAGDGAVHGLSVNGVASTPYNVAVGGTDWNPTLPEDVSSTNAPGTLATVQGYLPEMVWNSSCANPVYVTLFSATSALSLCNGQTAVTDGLNEVIGAGGGLSNCSTLTAGGTCQSGYAQPSWQTGVTGIQNFGARAVPDVSLLAGPRWVVCDQSVTTCAPSGTSGFVRLEGTSAAAPVMSAIVGLLNEAVGGANGKQGNLNPQLYALAKVEYGNTTTLSSCNSNNGQNIGTACVFNDITVGSNSQPCSASGFTGAQSGSTPAATCASGSGDTFGIIELNGAPVYAAASGYDLASGLGSLNAGNFVGAVFGLQVPPQALKAAASGTSVTLSWTADPFATSYNIYQASSSGQEGNTPSKSGVSGTSVTLSALNSGQPYYFEITAVTNFGESVRSNEAQVTLVPAAPTGISAVGSASAVQLSWNSSAGATSYNVYQGSSAGAESSTPVASGLTTTSYTVSGTPGQSFYFKVAAVNAGGTSALSSEANASVSVPGSPSHGGGSMSALDVILGSILLAVQLCLRRRAVG
jgi:subtilase family serine protease